MFKIRTLKTSLIIVAQAALICTKAMAISPEQRITALGRSENLFDRTLLAPCFNDTERLSRLECYDRVLARPTDEEVTAEVVTPLVPAVIPALVFTAGLLASPYVTEAGVYVSLKDRETGRELPAFDNEGNTFELTTVEGETESSPLKEDTDVFLALESQAGGDEPAVLVVSCENNITRFRVFWYTPFEERYTSVRFHYDNALSEEGGRELRRFRVRQNGYAVENARGLDSIRLTKGLSAAEITQVGVGAGENIRSAFFNTAALTEALPIVARHCSWSLSNSSD
ncbi:type VI secretion system-associated protein TagO [Halocynthiibacter namhaensis]|uniref:type VI secretion system-associated protein TagO n=1 Tax=Halocynthiibacter namhaensis TaxID=1290553 RepID=UPI0005798ED6|nr:type VI secretion system-associated protein TagO [Halocynthiibacter namhaensis]